MNSDDDVSDEDPSDLFDTDNVVVCQYDKVSGPTVCLNEKTILEPFYLKLELLIGGIYLVWAFGCENVNLWARVIHAIYRH